MSSPTGNGGDVVALTPGEEGILGMYLFLTLHVYAMINITLFYFY